MPHRVEAPKCAQGAEPFDDEGAVLEWPRLQRNVEEEHECKTTIQVAVAIRNTSTTANPGTGVTVTTTPPKRKPEGQAGAHKQKRQNRKCKIKWTKTPVPPIVTNGDLGTAIEKWKAAGNKNCFFAEHIGRCKNKDNGRPCSMCD